MQCISQATANLPNTVPKTEDKIDEKSDREMEKDMKRSLQTKTKDAQLHSLQEKCTLKLH